MTAQGTISAMGYVALRTRDLRASTALATDILGLRSIENTGTKAYLAAAAAHHEIVYVKSDTDGVDHIGLMAANVDEVRAIREKVLRGGWSIIAELPIE